MDAIGIAASGLRAYQTWMDLAANNIANLDTLTPTSGSAFQAAQPIIGANPGGSGAAVTGIGYTSAQGRLEFSPDHPLADSRGYVRAPDTDLVDQLPQMIIAQEGFRANLATLARARQAYQSLLDA